MGIETAILVGITAASIGSSYANAKKQSKAIRTQAALNARQSARKTNALAASQKTSFLSSGINLTGEDNTTPNTILDDTYTKGKEDIDLIKSNANAKLDALWSEERSKYMKQIGGMALGVAGGSMFAAPAGVAGAGSATIGSGMSGAGITGSAGNVGSTSGLFSGASRFPIG